MKTDYKIEDNEGTLGVKFLDGYGRNDSVEVWLGGLGSIRLTIEQTFSLHKALTAILKVSGAS